MPYIPFVKILTNKLAIQALLWNYARSLYAIFLIAMNESKLEMESRLHAFLFNGYQNDVHPGEQWGNKTAPVSVLFDAQVIRILEVVSKNRDEGSLLNSNTTGHHWSPITVKIQEMLI